MERMTLKVCMLLMAVLTLTACSKEEDTITPLSEIIDPARYNNGQPANQNGVDGQSANQDGKGDKGDNGQAGIAPTYLNILDDMKGVYDGEWKINGEKVDAVKSNLILSSFRYLNYYCYDFSTFPFMAIASRNGLQPPAIDFESNKPKITTYSSLLAAWSTDESNYLYYLLFKNDQTEKNGINSGSFLTLVGYSTSTVYFELKPIENSLYMRYPYVVTLEDGSYYAIFLDVLPSQSTFILDNSTKTITFTCTIPQIEIYDQEGNKTINKLDPEMILTFTSTQKTKAGESGD